jgi:uncharacterized iron-regulated protein
VLAAVSMVGSVFGQETAEWAVHSSDGSRADLEAITASAQQADVVLVGELHDDEPGHRFKRYLLEALDRGDPRRLELSLEMFEQDVQLVIDEYLAGHINRAHFLASSRPWPNYERDYHSLVEYARANGFPVIAANTPRRYVNIVARGGQEALANLFGQSRAWLPPLPLPGPSDRYRRSFFDRVAGMHGHGGPSPERMFEAQHLWDAGMAHAIAGRLARSEPALVMHVAGSFHVEDDTGIPEMLRSYRPGVRILTIVIRPAREFESAEHANLADFVVITTPSTE